MKETVKKYWFPAVTFLLTLVSALFWVALRVNHSGISKFLGADTNPSFLVMNLPIMVCVLAWLGCGMSVPGILFWNRKKWPAVTAFVIGAIVTVAAVFVVLFGAKDYLRFIMVHFWKSLWVCTGILVFTLVLFFPVTGKSRLVLTLKGVAVTAVILGAVVIGYALRPCNFTYGAVVYAVEDDYQIVFSTSDSAIAWVEIGGKPYYDLYAGSMRSVDKVHKIEVPQTVLDAAGGYTVYAQQMIYRGPFGGHKGKVISQSYDFYPVDASNGLDYFALSDVHEAVAPAIRAASTQRDALDFIVLLGDLVSMVETEADAQLANELAHGITGGEIPVIYARGNHEIKGEYSEELYKYVGSKNQSYTYPVTLSGTVYAVVLDLGEDHEDDWWEYYGTAQFDLYRAVQTQMLKDILGEGAYKAYPYRMALCHIPVTYVEEEGLFEAFRQEWTALLNEMDVDICLGGHLHKLWPMLPGAVEPGTELIYAFDYIGDSGKSPGGYLTEHNFPAFLVGRRSLVQTGSTQSNGYTQYMGMAVSAAFDVGTQTAWYVNSEEETVTGVYPFEGNYPDRTFTKIVTELKRPE